MKDFKELRIWQSAHDLALSVYEITRLFPKNELYGITSQLQRAALSVPTNIVEGFGISTKKDFRNFLVIARGSLQETRYLLFFTADLKFITLEQFHTLDTNYSVLKRQINAFIKNLD